MRRASRSRSHSSSAGSSSIFRFVTRQSGLNLACANSMNEAPFRQSTQLLFRSFQTEDWNSHGLGNRIHPSVVTGEPQVLTLLNEIRA